MHLVACSSGSWAPRSIRRCPRSLGRSPRENHLLFPLNEPTNAPTATGRLQHVSVGPHRARYALFASLRVLAYCLCFFLFLVSFTFYRRALVCDRKDSTGPEEVIFLADGDRLKVRATLVSATSHVPVTY